MSIAMNSTINNYTYTYKGQMRPMLDKDDDAAWSRGEVQAYADSYAKATGKTLDVDKIMETYAGEDGRIDVKNQAKMIEADALGLSNLKVTTTGTSTAGTTTGTTGTTAAKVGSSSDVFSLINQYTNGSKNYLSLQLDKDGDAQWSRSEVEAYAAAYNKATGKTIDVDSIMKTYAGENGNISTAMQKKIANADALGLSDVIKARESITYDTSLVSTSNTSATKPSRSMDLNDLMESMSSAKKASFSASIQKSTNMGNMLNAFLAGGISGSTFDMFSVLSQQNTAKLYAAQLQYNKSSNASSTTGMSNSFMNMIA